MLTVYLLFYSGVFYTASMTYLNRFLLLCLCTPVLANPADTARASVKVSLIVPERTAPQRTATDKLTAQFGPHTRQRHGNVITISAE